MKILKNNSLCLFLLPVEASSQSFFNIFMQIVILKVVTEKLLEQEKNFVNWLGHVNCIYMYSNLRISYQ